ncbi:anthranilate synthase component II [Mesobacillus maritimus]|uniref:Aminodeoxychorismate/anthranilate synthase component II n=1 Tax=Mesobacillus maritimus TaxID=1643336 RepID=A0ABS7K3B3_9BACI|nr:aminodeoxychorismate/anthranilate synthase component II [Mesobacillus maritimus]MBY0096754.1 aminodeoxychorismate/anthranilate synthase component II [Mesobacillus maritimus]
MILLIDNYDSFTYNLYQYLGELGVKLKVVRNDKVTISEIETMKPTAIIISPGPGRPENAGICVELIRTLAHKVPILGICLGHQAIGYAFNGTIMKAGEIMHGKVSEISHNGSSLFSTLPGRLSVMRYHSLVIEKDSVPSELEILASSTDDNEIMAVKHKEYPVYGLQFHPESIGTKQGKQLLENFIAETRKEKGIYETLS